MKRAGFLTPFPFGLLGAGVDSITQAALGTAVSYACWSKPLGRRALPLGFALGTLPDLDIVAYPLLDEVQQLYWHRGESHSIWFLIFGTWLTAWLLRRVPWTRALSTRQALGGVGAIYATHVAIDVFTVYGTQLLAPFSRHGFGTNNLFIIDPLFTLPLLLGIIGALVLPREKLRVRVNALGLALATAYTGWSFVAQAVAARAFAEARAQHGVAAERTFTSASAFNTVLWRQVAETEDGFWIGYWSWFDPADAEIDFRFVPRRPELVQPIEAARSFAVVNWFSQGWWVATPAGEGRIKVIDLRFGDIPTAINQPPLARAWPFAWEYERAAGVEAPLVQTPPQIEGFGPTLELLWDRVRGRHTGW